MNDLAAGIFWYWNATPTPSGISRQLKNIAGAGFDCVYIHPMPETFHQWNFFTGMKCSYLGKKYFELMEIALAECRKLGLTMMFYDEGGWPSGGVLDRLIARYPACRGRFLVKDEQGKIQEKRADFPDLLDKKTTEHFIEMTHELYRKHFGREFGKTIKGIFTDEPFFQMVSDENQIFYTPAMDESAEKIFGCSFANDLLPYLWHGMENHPHAPGARRKYMAIASRLFAENYFAILEKWCEKHHLHLAGHVNHEDTFFVNGNCGDLPEQFAHIHIPGVDAIWRQIYPGKSTGVYANFASSAAIAQRRSHALCECFNVYSYALTPPAVNWVANALFLRGINHLIPMPYLYSDFGKHKICCSTDLSHRVPLWQTMGELLRRWKIAGDFDLSKMEVPIHILARNRFSIPDCLWGEKPEREKAHKEMEDMLEIFDRNAVPWRFTSTGELQKAKDFPEVLIVTQELDEWEKAIVDRAVKAGTKIISNWDEELKKFAPFLVTVPESGCLVRYCVRNSKTAAMVFNPGECSVDFRFSSPENWGETPVDEAMAELYPLQKKGQEFTMTLPPGALRILEKGKHPAPAAHWETQEITLDWQLKKVKKLRMAAEKPTVYQTIEADQKQLKKGFWQEADFSGIITLSATVDLPESGAGFICFDRICHAAKLSVNGEYCGVQVAQPWAFPVKLKKGENQLVMEIYSSAGNEWRRCVNEELEPREWVNCYLPTMRKYTIDDAETGVSDSAILRLQGNTLTGNGE